MKIQHELKDKEGLFFIRQNDHKVAEMRYKMTSPSIMNIYHTEVSDALQGKNIGRELVEAGVNYARHNHYKIEPSCSFAQKVFETEKDFNDIRA